MLDTSHFPFSIIISLLVFAFVASRKLQLEYNADVIVYHCFVYTEKIVILSQCFIQVTATEVYAATLAEEKERLEVSYPFLFH